MIGISSCHVKQPTVPMMSHADVMTQDYPTKKSVFMKFGAPTNKETYENIENWYFKIGEVTNSKTLGFSSGWGKVSQDPFNPYVPAINRSLVISQSQFTNQTTKSNMFETHVKFWFRNDTVIKWETFGVDYSRPVQSNSDVLLQAPNSPQSLPLGSAEFLFRDDQNKCFIYSHHSINRDNKTGINGPLNYLEVQKIIENNPDFNNAVLPTMTELKKVFDSSSQLQYALLRNSLIVWSNEKTPSGTIKCLNFRTGEIIEKSPEELLYFVPLVKVPYQ